MSLFPPRPPKPKKGRKKPPPKPFTQARPKGKKRMPIEEAMKLMEQGITRSSLEEQDEEPPERILICE